MPDLKKLLAPLDEDEMPDRWEAIGRRPVTPVQEPSRSRLPVFAVVAAMVALIVAVVAGLMPLANVAERVPGSTDEPPAWLVDQAYKLAYQNGDITPDAAAWTLADPQTIASTFGQQGGLTNAEGYLVVLDGEFTAFDAKVPSGAELPTGHVAIASFDPASHDVTDWGVRNQTVDVAGLVPFQLPPPSQTFSAASGWHAAIPPGWHTQTAAITLAGDQVDQSVIATTAPASLTYAHAPMPMVAGPGFPADGVAVVVTQASSALPGFPANLPPVSLETSAEVSSGADGSKIEMVLIQGPAGVYSAAVRIGPLATSIDRSAIEGVVSSITWDFAPSPTSAPPTATPWDAAGTLPTTDSVVDGRFVESVQLDGGLLRVDPPPADMETPGTPTRDVEAKYWASPTFQGKRAVTFGFGLVTLHLSQLGIQEAESVPAWIAFANGGTTYSCPNMTVAPSHADLPSDGFAAIAIAERGMDAFAYTASADVCGTVSDPKVEMARHVESIPWEQVGAVKDGRVEIRYAPAGCGQDAVYDVSGDGDIYTLAVEMSVPDVALPCPFAPEIDTSVLLTGDGGGTVAELRHAPEGIVQQVEGPTP